MKKIILILLLLAIAAGAGFWIKRHRSVAAASEEEKKPVARVQVAPLQIQPIVDAVPAFGLIESAPSGSRAITLAYDAIVSRIAVSPGSTVAAGDLLMEIEPTPDAELAVNSARSLAQLAEQGLVSTRQRYDLKLATSQDMLAAEQAAEYARLKLSSLESRGQAADGRLTAPFAGIVTKLGPQPGAVVPAGTALATIVAGAQFEAHLALEAAEAARVKADQTVVVTPVDRPDAASVNGTVRQVGGLIDPQSGAVDIRVTLPAGTSWLAGEHVQGSIQVEEKSALVAPRAAVLPDDNQQVLFTIKDHKAVKHAVQLGISTDNAVEVITKDLQAGDQAVIIGNYELEEGMAVEIASKEAKAGGDKDSGAKSDPEKKP